MSFRKNLKHSNINWVIVVNGVIKIPHVGGFSILGPWHDSMPMRLPSNLNIVLMDYAGLSMVANRHSSCSHRCQNILHNGAKNKFGLKPCQMGLCILQRYFDSWHRFYPIHVKIKPGTQMQMQCWLR